MGAVSCVLNDLNCLNKFNTFKWFNAIKA